MAKTEEELEDRRNALYGDYDNADDVMINVTSNAPAKGSAPSQHGLNGMSRRDSLDSHVSGLPGRHSMDSLSQAESGNLSRQQSLQQDQAAGLTGHSSKALGQQGPGAKRGPTRDTSSRRRAMAGGSSRFRSK